MLDIQATLNTALTHHREGRIQQAEQIYRQVLAIEPEDSLIPESLASQGFSYFLEVFIASEVVPDLSSGVPFFTQKKWCERLIRYAEMDS